MFGKKITLFTKIALSYLNALSKVVIVILELQLLIQAFGETFKNLTLTVHEGVDISTKTWTSPTTTTLCFLVLLQIYKVYCH